MRFAWTATGRVTHGDDEPQDHTFIVVTEVESRDYALNQAQKGLLALSGEASDRVLLEIISLECLGQVAITG